MRHGVALVRGPRAEVERRTARLERFLAPLGCAWRVRWSGGVTLLSWEAGAGDEPAAGRGAADATPEHWTWGERLPPALDAPELLLAASDAELRALDGSHACFALSHEAGSPGGASGPGDRATGPGPAGAARFPPGRARVVSGAGGPSGLFAAGDGQVEAWATSASAAGLLGTGALRLDPGALPELLAFGAPLGERTHVAGVTAVPPAARIDLESASADPWAGDPRAGDETPKRPATCAPAAAAPPPARAVSSWPRAERWAPLPEDEADAAARAALLATLAARLPREPAPWLALTAGRDSPVLAAAVRILGLEVPTFTFGAPDWPDVAGARAIAAELGLPHHHHALGALPPDRVPAEADRDARWFDGLAGVGPTGPPALPAAMSAMVTGAGAEVGRAYSYQAVARSRPRPRTEDLVAAMDPAGRLPGAPREAHAAAAGALRTWLAQPGLPAGWRALDALYVEHRVGRWGTARVARTHPGPILAPFSSPPLARALSALGLDDRLAVGFHRRLVAEVAPGVALQPMQTQRRGIPAPARRAARALRARRAAARAPQPWPWAGLWTERPALYAWVADDLLADPRLAAWLGPEWARALRKGFAAGDARHAERALLAAGLVLWARAAETA